MATEQKPRGIWPRIKRWAWRGGYSLGGLLLFYASFLLLGFVPVNNGYQPPPPDDRVTLFIRSNEIHTDFVLPVVHDETGIDWRMLFPHSHFRGQVWRHQCIAIGWGDRGFFVDTPTWADLKIATVLNALFVPSEAVLHVEYLFDAEPGDYMHEFSVNREQYRELTRFIESSIAVIGDQGTAKTATEKSYGPDDRFYLATGSYHLFNTCNQWTGRGLARAGVRTGIWTPLKPQVLVWLPRSEP